MAPNVEPPGVGRPRAAWDRYAGGGIDHDEDSPPVWSTWAQSDDRRHNGWRRAAELVRTWVGRE
jgi:hypothetical protein